MVSESRRGVAGRIIARRGGRAARSYGRRGGSLRRLGAGSRRVGAVGMNNARRGSVGGVALAARRGRSARSAGIPLKVGSVSPIGGGSVGRRRGRLGIGRRLGGSVALGSRSRRLQSKVGAARVGSAVGGRSRLGVGGGSARGLCGAGRGSRGRLFKRRGVSPRVNTLYCE